MNGKVVARAVLLICLSAVFAFGQNRLFQYTHDLRADRFGFDILNLHPRNRSLSNTEEIAYQQLFRMLLSFEKEATKQANHGGGGGTACKVVG